MEDRVAAVFAREVFFVAGAPHSGTVRVQLMLDAHPEVRCAGEGHFTDWFGPPLKDLLGDYNARLAANNDALYRGHGPYAGYTAGDFRYLMKTAMGLAWAKLEVPPGKRLLGEATPALVQRLEFLEMLFPQAKVLHVVRDGRDAAASALAQTLRRGDDPSLVPGGPAWYGFIDAFARQWTEAVRTALLFGASRPERYHEVRIEDIQADPPTHLGAVLRFLGVADTAAGIDACVAGGAPSHQPAGKRDLFDDRALGILRDHMGPMLRQFDYPE